MINLYLKNPLTDSKKPIKNAFNTSYLKRSNNLFTGGFSLPVEDNYIDTLHQYSFIEMYDDDKRVELFVIVKSSETFSNCVPVIKYDLLDALFLLNLSVIDFLQLTNPTTKEALNAVLSYQYLPYWKLGTCDFARGFSYQWENENGLLDPLMSVIGDTADPYFIERDTTQFPFVIHFRKPKTKVSARVRQGYNMKGFTITQDGKNIVNWILPLGNAEGINAVNIKKLNGGKNYLMDQASMDKYFPAMNIWKDERYTVAENLKAAAESRLNAWKEPEVLWDVSAVDLTKVLHHPDNIKANQNKAIRANEIGLDDLVVVQTKRYGDINLRVSEVGKTDMTGSPGDLDLTITNENYNPFSYDEKRQQEISKVTANGAQNIIPFIFDREADDSEPVEYNIEIPDDVVNVNSCYLWIKTTNFRATSKGNKSADAVVTSSTTSGGGAYVSSSSTQAGGASVQSSTSSAGGGTTVGNTSSSGGGGTSSVASLLTGIRTGPNESISGTGNHNHFVNFNHNLQHSHTVPSHTHNFSVTVPNHTHSVSIKIPAHTHNFGIDIPSHTHQVSLTIPGHTHPIIYGIFKYQNLPTKLDIWIDDNKISTTDTSVDRFDLINYMKKDGDGKISRSSHTLRIKPNDLARLEIQIMLTVFIKSRIGGQL